MSGGSEKPVAKGIAFATVALIAACSFPEHTFVEDSQFYGSGATGAVGGASGTGGGSGGTGATGGGSGNENCLNGGDDDGDGAIDCGDSDCTAGYLCAPLAPSGWEGPVAHYDGPTPAPDCGQSGGFPSIKQNANADLKPATGICPTCECGTASGMYCTADLLVAEQPTCSGATWGPPGGGPTKVFSSVPTNQCQLLPSLCYDTVSKPQGAIFSNVQATGGSCASSSTGQKQLDPPTWDGAIRACGATGSGMGCSQGDACFPKPASPFDPSLCVYQMGNVPCPGGAYSIKKLGFLNFVDNRDCGACGCAAPGGATCDSPTIKLYTNDVCTADEQTMAGPNVCLALTADPDPLPSVSGCTGSGPAETRAGRFTATVNGGSCTPTGGTITGTVDPTEPVTFCCL